LPFTFVECPCTKCIEGRRTQSQKHPPTNSTVALPNKRPLHTTLYTHASKRRNTTSKHNTTGTIKSRANTSAPSTPKAQTSDPTTSTIPDVLNSQDPPQQPPAHISSMRIVSQPLIPLANIAQRHNIDLEAHILQQLLTTKKRVKTNRDFNKLVYSAEVHSPPGAGKGL
ncbi:MAG: hypothetical protein ACK56F_01400, partial [bacterium]